jgi:IstB-like ATP binding protein
VSDIVKPVKRLAHDGVQTGGVHGGWRTTTVQRATAAGMRPGAHGGAGQTQSEEGHACAAALRARWRPRPVHRPKPIMTTPTTETALAPPWRSQLDYLKLTYFAEHDEVLTQQAAEKRWPQLSYLERLVGGEHQRRQARASERRVHAVAFPQIKIVDDFHWSWPTLNEAKGRHLLRLGFIEQKTNVGFLGPTGTEKTPLACAIAYHACQRGHSGIFTTAVDIVNYLLEAQAAHRHLPSVICPPSSAVRLPITSANSASNLSTCGPSGAIQFVAKASRTNSNSYVPRYGEER